MRWTGAAMIASQAHPELALCAPSVPPARMGSADEANTPRTWRRPRLRRTGPVPGRDGGYGAAPHKIVDYAIVVVPFDCALVAATNRAVPEPARLADSTHPHLLATVASIAPAAGATPGTTALVDGSTVATQRAACLSKGHPPQVRELEVSQE